MSLTGDALIRELERKSNDECMVYNVTQQDFTVEWDGHRFLFPNINKDIGYGKGARVVPRYIAMHYIKHMTDHLINLRYEATVKSEKEKFTKRGEWFGQKEIQIAPKTNNKDLRVEVFKTLWGGVVREFGMDEQPAGGSMSTKQDNRPMMDQLLDRVEKEGGYRSADEFLKQVTQEQDDITQQT